MIKVFLAGFTGSMGQKVANLINQHSEYEITGGLSHRPVADPTEYGLKAGTAVFNDLTAVQGDYDVWIDFTQPQVVFADVKFAIEHQITPIVGTSGLSTEQKMELQQLADQYHVNGLIAANFGLSAVLLMQFAQQAARYFSDVEVIEMHHADKTDAPSGTAMQTVDLINQSKQQPNENTDGEPSRGMIYKGVPIHAVRLPGYVAHEQVLFGSTGEALTIRQDSFDRQSFMQGLWVALTKLDQLHGLVDGLENIL